MPAKTLKELFIDELKDMYDAEQRLTKVLPKMAKAANSKDLVAAFEAHLKQTQTHVTRLERVLEICDETPTRKTCKAMVGLLEEGTELMHEDGPPSLRDAALIAAAQKVEHYEIATYGCLRTWAQLLKETEAANLLEKTLLEEGTADKKLTFIAESLDAEAMMGEDGEDERETVPARRRSNSSSTKPRSR